MIVTTPTISNPKTISVVLKTVERCNIDCTYCYFFNSNDDSYKFHPPYISQNVIEKTAAFLAQGAEDLDIDIIKIIFHGGEPLMQKIDKFDAMCDTFKNTLHKQKVEFSTQTNAMLINDKWIEVLHKHNVSIGISIDGPAEYHDKYRVDKKGNGTHKIVEQKIRELKASPLIDDVGVLTVINPEFDAKIIYRYFVDELSIKKIDFLPMDCNYDIKPSFDISKMAQFWRTLFTEWVMDANPEIKIRFIDSIINLFKGGHSTIYGVNMMSEDSTPLISIASNGALSPSDEFSSTDLTLMRTTNVENSTLREFFDDRVFKIINHAFYNSPKECKKCCWEKVCNGGGIVNRYSSINGFDNPSIYCSALKQLYTLIASTLLALGYSKEALHRSLSITVRTK